MSAARLWHSVRFRITMIAVASVVVVLAMGGLGLLTIQRGQLIANLDATLTQRADDLVSSQLDLSAPPLTLANLAGDDAVVQIVDSDGTILAASENAISAGVIGPTSLDRQIIRTVDALPVEDDEYRILSRPVELDSGRVTVHIASNTDDLRDVIGNLRTALWIVIPLAAAAIGAVVWMLVGRTLRPVEAIRRDVASIGGADLDRRVSAPGTGDEIDRLANTMNEMLQRQERAASSQRRFVADASHELRSPLARMRTEIDTAAVDDGGSGSGVGSDGAGAELVRSLSDEVDHLGALVDDLLHLARSDAEEHQPLHRPVDLDDIVLEEIGRVSATTGLTVDVSRLSAAHLRGDPSQLRRLARNLLDNATRHARSVITIELGEVDASRVVFAVTDDGDGVEASAADRIFERFVRLDDARHRDRGGTGLGLAIARDIVDRHGGTIRLDDQHASGARFVVTFSRDPDA
jgi:signal transduction histidine kinase